MFSLRASLSRRTTLTQCMTCTPASWAAAASRSTPGRQSPKVFTVPGCTSLMSSAVVDGSPTNGVMSYGKGVLLSCRVLPTQPEVCHRAQTDRPLALVWFPQLVLGDAPVPLAHGDPELT